MKILKYILFTLGGIIALILIVALFMPKTYHVERSIVIKAPQGVILEQVANLKKQNEWSPWAAEDPNMEVSYAGADGQVGSSSSWKSEKMGEGTQTITKLTNDRVEAKLEFKEPMEGTADAYFQTQPEGDGVKASWGIKGKDKYPMNIMILFMDNMIGKQYEKGLASLKVRCEDMAKDSLR